MGKGAATGALDNLSKTKELQSEGKKMSETLVENLWNKYKWYVVGGVAFLVTAIGLAVKFGSKSNNKKK